MSWLESIVDQHIREAAARGEFDDLPGAGKPIPGLDRPYDPGWWARNLARRERLTAALRDELDEVERGLARLWPLPSETAVRAALSDLNARITDVNRQLPRGRRAPLLDPDDIVDLWRHFGLAGGGRRRS